MFVNEEAIPIYRDQDFYIPHFEIRLGGRSLSKDVVNDILSVTYKDNIKEIDSFEISINNWDAGNPNFENARSRTFKYSDTSKFDPGQKLHIQMGYLGKGHMRSMISGEITSLRPSFPASGGSTLSVSGQNVLHRLRKEQHSERYENLTDSQIAQRIAQRINVKIVPKPNEIEGETVYDYILQDNQRDINFLMERARHVGYDLYVQDPGPSEDLRNSIIYFGPSEGVVRGIYELVYGLSLMQFTPNLTTANQVGKVVVRSWDRSGKKEIKGEATRNELKTRGVGSRGGQKAIEDSFADRTETITDVPVEDKEEADRVARRTLENIAKDMIKGSGSTVGLPDLRAGSVLHICGLGERFSGRYFVTSTTHTINDSGYTTQFECRREEISSRNPCYKS
jgi:phage protein D